MVKEFLVANIPGLLCAVRDLDPALISTVHAQGVACLQLSVGDVADGIVLCVCGEHHKLQFGQPIPSFQYTHETVEAAQKKLRETADQRDPPPKEWDSSDSQSTSSEEAPSESSPAWSPRSYYDSDEVAAPASSEDDEPIAKRLRPLWLGEFFSEPSVTQGMESDEPEYLFSD